MSRIPVHPELTEAEYADNTILRNTVANPTLLEFPHNFPS